MSVQIHAPARRELGPSFSLDEVVERWNVSAETANEFIRGFMASGYVVRAGLSSWKVTPRGYKASAELGDCEDRRGQDPFHFAERAS